jgi:Rieske Fe-S protein
MPDHGPASSAASAEPDPNATSRRAFIAVATAGVSAVALAACSTASSGDTTSSPAGGSTAAGSGGTGLAKLADIPVGQAIAATSGGKPIIIARPTASTVAAFSAICTHAGCTVAPAAAELHCPCHGSKYNALTGAVLQGPAPKALTSIPVKVSGTEVVLG